LQARFWIADPDREDAGIDLSTTTNYNLSGEVTVEDGNISAVGQS
jgi:hypothetical protein